MHHPLMSIISRWELDQIKVGSAISSKCLSDRDHKICRNAYESFQTSQIVDLGSHSSHTLSLILILSTISVAFCTICGAAWPSHWCHISTDTSNNNGFSDLRTVCVCPVRKGESNIYSCNGSSQWRLIIGVPLGLWMQLWALPHWTPSLISVPYDIRLVWNSDE